MALTLAQENFLDSPEAAKLTDAQCSAHLGVTAAEVASYRFKKHLRGPRLPPTPLPRQTRRTTTIEGHGVATPRTKAASELTPTQKENLKILRQSGWSPQQASESTGINPKVVK